MTRRQLIQTAAGAAAAAAAVPFARGAITIQNGSPASPAPGSEDRYPNLNAIIGKSKGLAVIAQARRVSGVVIPEDASVEEKTAAQELVEFLSYLAGRRVPIIDKAIDNAIVLGTPASSAMVKAAVSQAVAFEAELPKGLQPIPWTVGNLTDEGFLIVPLPNANMRLLMIGARMPRGVIRGVYTLMDLLRLGATDIFKINQQGNPRYSLRSVWLWGGQPDSQEMLVPQESPKVVLLAKLLAAMRVNSLVLRSNFDLLNPQEGIASYRQLGAYLQQYGIDLYFNMGYAAPAKWVKAHDNPYCPFNQDLQQYWANLAEVLGSGIPGFKGFVVKGMNAEHIPSPLACDCDKCGRLSSDARMLSGFHMIADPLKKHDSSLLYRTWTTGTDQDEEFHVFRTLVQSRDLPDNVMIMTKEGYGDFSMQEFPHPLIGQIRPWAPNPVEFEIYGEYRGGQDFPCAATELWAEWFKFAQDKVDGIMGIAQIEQEFWDHPLNMANWYSFGQLAWNPAARADEIIENWTKIAYGEAYPSMMKILKLTRLASERMLFTKGIWTQSHSKLPGLHVLDNHFSGPFSGLPPIPNTIGWNKTLDMYPYERQVQYASDPNMKYFLGRYLTTPAVKEEFVQDKVKAVQIVEEWLQELDRTRSKLEPGVYADLKKRSELNLNDAKIWKDFVSLFFDYRLGTLTRANVEAAWTRAAASPGSKASAGFEGFINDLKTELAKTPSTRSG